MKLTRLVVVMDEKKVRPEDLAASTGLSIDTIRNARRGKSVSNSTQAAIERGLKVKREELI